MRSPKLLILVAVATWWAGCACAQSLYENDPSINLLREYLRINTSQPIEGNADYVEAVEFWKRQADSLGLTAQVYEYYAGKPIVVITWEGSDPSLPSVMLNSHMDVVAADELEWIYPPFDAFMEANGDIYGRGTQDMKSVGIWHLEAVRQLKNNNIRLARTIHLTMVPDEEVGGAEGMEVFVNSQEFADLKVGVALDEGIAFPNGSYIVMYAERTPWPVVVTCTGPGGHGSTIPVNTAADKFRRVIDSFLNFRQSQLDIVRTDASRDLGTLTAINLTGVSGGTASNIIPDSLSAMFDIRIGVGVDQTAFNNTLHQWVAAAGNGDCTLEFIRQDEVSPATVTDDTNPYWVAFKKATDAMNMQVLTIVSPGSTDERFVRTKNVSGFGFAPLINTPSLLHTVNERINAQTFLDGIPIYYNIIESIASAY